MTTPGFKDTTAPRSPIKVKPRRQAGHSLRTMLFEERDGFLFYAGGVIMGILGMLVVCWLHWWQIPASAPWLPTLAAFVMVAGVVVAGWRRLVALRGVQLGLEGEIAVGQMLERMRVLGYEVLHDIPGEREGTNIDHVLVGPGGVFVIETKTRSKIGNQKVEYDGRRITIEGHDSSAALAQARACRDDVRRKLNKGLGHDDVPVRAIVVFTGWWVNEAKGLSSPSDVWVLNENRVESWIRNERPTLPDTVVRRVISALEH